MQARKMLPSSTPINSISTVDTKVNESITTMSVSIKDRIDEGKDMIHNTFAKLDRGTLIRGTIVLAGITCLVLMYIGVKAFLLRKKRQPKKYTLITDPTAMEEPLFGAHDNEEEIEDDTLFVRK